MVMVATLSRVESPPRDTMVGPHGVRQSENSKQQPGFPGIFLQVRLQQQLWGGWKTKRLDIDIYTWYIFKLFLPILRRIGGNKALRTYVLECASRANLTRCPRCNSRPGGGLLQVLLLRGAIPGTRYLVVNRTKYCY